MPLESDSSKLGQCLTDQWFFCRANRQGVGGGSLRFHAKIAGDEGLALYLAIAPPCPNIATSPVGFLHLASAKSFAAFCSSSSCFSASLTKQAMLTRYRACFSKSSVLAFRTIICTAKPEVFPMNRDPSKAPAAFVVLCISCGRQLPILISAPILDGAKPPKWGRPCSERIASSQGPSMAPEHKHEDLRVLNSQLLAAPPECLHWIRNGACFVDQDDMRGRGLAGGHF